MDIEYDKHKNQRNVELRGLSFELVKRFQFDNVLEVEQRVDNELRYFALGHIGKRLYALVYTVRDRGIRVISLRKANKREATQYEQFKNNES